MSREVDEITEGWRDEVHPRIVQAGDLRRVAAELERLRGLVAELEGAATGGDRPVSVVTLHLDGSTVERPDGRAP